MFDKNNIDLSEYIYKLDFHRMITFTDIKFKDFQGNLFPQNSPEKIMNVLR